MSEKWILTVKTSLPDRADEGLFSWNTSGYVFDSFEEGRAKFREILKSYAFGDNAMFGGTGNIIGLSDYLDDFIDEEDEEESEPYINLKKCMASILSGGAYVDFEEIDYGDVYANIDESDNTLIIYGNFDGPLNGIDPKIMTNIGDMTEAKDYCFYADDMFSDEEASSELYIDLIKAK